MSGNLGAWLRAQREERLWSRAELARRLITAAENHGDTTMPSADDVGHNIYRWERGTVTPGERYRLYYCDVLGIPASRFGISGTPAQADDTAQDAKVIIIVINLPEGQDAQVRITSPAAAPVGSAQGRDQDSAGNEPAHDPASQAAPQAALARRSP